MQKNVSAARCRHSGRFQRFAFIRESVNDPTNVLTIKYMSDIAVLVLHTAMSESKRSDQKKSSD